MHLLIQIQNQIKQAITKTWPDLLIPIIEVTPAPNSVGQQNNFGDYSCAVALNLAKQLRANPLEIAEQLKNALGQVELIADTTVTAPGFINFHLDYPTVAQIILAPATRNSQLATRPRNIVIEHTSINPNKAAHVGHLRNACLGDSLARVLRTLGHQVEVQNYIDDLGLQVADSVVAYETFGKLPEGVAWDKWFWEVYAKIQPKYESQPELIERREAILKEMEQGQNQTAKRIVKEMVSAHLTTLKRFGIAYDNLVYEHDIVGHHLWDNVFTELKNKRLIVQPKSGKHKGAWIVKFGTTEDEDKVLVRSNSVPTYVAKDLAYALWKFGLTSTLPGYTRKFSQADEVVNVIDNRQAYPQAVIKQTLSKLGYQSQADNYLHLSYGVVKLSERAMQTLGETTTGKTTYSMSGRAGIGVIVDDLFTTVMEAQIKAHQTEPQIAEQIAVGSIRYYMLKTRPEREIIFDFDEALKTDGNTGIYLQYAYARANNILAKVAPSLDGLGTLLTLGELNIVPPTNGGVTPRHPELLSPELVEGSGFIPSVIPSAIKESTLSPRHPEFISGSNTNKAIFDNLNPQEKNLIKVLTEFDFNLSLSADELDPSKLCDYAYQLANAFAKFYETSPVVGANTEAQKEFRTGLVTVYAKVLSEVLSLLGIPQLDRI
ncbi:arginine--tRNA ligase [candidate division Kazan bacterium RIFCSPHIGHO2_01_FULL_44_14]|uniref:Arginine--tRNA ligase n=1 Tax=candidate division Kazan bacterium RIFCSPLOWO2_01_FULL_45_19 TaxID=1798538 RepID=A0A1F4NRD7_UNCK3|nr:hypothetical protein [uncultured bacterium]OGB73452.1 MAG: arginine--tRNA ligase [candidate division Kazan bacterium RIFCSPLOWO2_01_FULL_45_19]OGB77697.1 MAG: arginine--tRNA ligase [candidate division Kazan bacterium RIFCSPHIGHO2_01_FULL_44_14]